MNAKILEGALNTSGPSTGNIPGVTTQKTTVTTKNGVPVTTQTATTGAGSKAITPAGGGSSSSSVSVDMSTLTPLSTTEKSYDYNKILNNSTDAYLHDEQIRNDQEKWRESIEQGDVYNAKNIVDFTNQRIGQYNQEKGLQPGQNGYVKPIVIGTDIVQDPAGKFHINMPTSEFAAKTALASIDGPYVSRQTDFNKDIGNYLLAAKKEKDANALGWARLAAQNKLNQAKIKAMLPEDVTPFLKNEWNKNLQGQLSASGTNTIGGKKDLVKTNLNKSIPANESMVLFSFKGGKPDILEPIDSKPIYQLGQMKDGVLDQSIPNQLKPDKIVGYKGGYYQPIYFDATGNRLTKDGMAQGYGEFVRTAKKAGYKASDLPNFDDYIKSQLKDGTFKYGMQGAKQLLTEEEYIGAQQAISNMLTKSKQQGIFSGIFSESESGNPSQQPEE